MQLKSQTLLSDSGANSPGEGDGSDEGAQEGGGEVHAIQVGGV